jgi:hypothetical protein
MRGIIFDLIIEKEFCLNRQQKSRRINRIDTHAADGCPVRGFFPLA